MMILEKCLAVLALGLGVTALASPSYHRAPAAKPTRHAPPLFANAAPSSTIGVIGIGPA
jgi:hypothetical protein